MGEFLSAANDILEFIGKPLSIVELTDLAIKHGYLKTQGATPNNTMRARLSQELRQNGSVSRFQRVAKNRFALRDWKLKEYFADEFKKDVSSEVVVCFRADAAIFQNNKINGIFPITKELLEYLKDRNNIFIIPRKEAEKLLNYKQIISYVVLKSKDGQVLTYTRGKYSSAHKTLLKGRQSLGFGGHVLETDTINLFGINDSGVVNAAIREVKEELKRYPIDELKIISVIHDSTSTEGYKHLGIVLESELPDNFDFQKLKRELSINGIRLLSPEQLWDNFHLFEFWSQLIIKDQFESFKPPNISKIAPLKRPKDSNKIVLVGEIASGKTSILKALSEAYNYRYVSARQCLIEILNIPDFNNSNRTYFQEQAQKFIITKNGPLNLARKISEKVDDTGITLIDGIRNIGTIRELKLLLGDCIIIYVDCPRDKALKNFITRSEEKNSNVEFVKSREHSTELELPLILEEADAILFNADERQNTIEIFTNWLDHKL